jgi:membrane-bound inhibitor of C-type lysozyme
MAIFSSGTASTVIMSKTGSGLSRSSCGSYRFGFRLIQDPADAGSFLYGMIATLGKLYEDKAMKRPWSGVTSVAVVLASNLFAGASDLTLHLNGAQTFSRTTVKYQCDSQAKAMGLYPGVFSVEYINGGGNSLAIVPVGADTMVFVNVITGSGARYVAKEFTWWDAAGGAIFSSDSLAGKASSNCHRVQ